MAPVIRLNYDELSKIASVFDEEADRLRQAYQRVQRSVDVLQGGDWVGEGASAFYREMSSEVLPAFKRLLSALEAAGRTIREIAQTFKDAEDEIARLFAAFLAAFLLGAGSAAAVAGAVGGAIGGALGAAGGALAGAAQAVAAAAAAQARRALEEAAVDRKLSMFSRGVRDLVKQSPTLRAQVLQAEQSGYVFQTGSVADGYYTDWDQSTIVIDQPLGDATTVSHIAHEVSHATTAQQHSIPATPTMTRDEYVQQNVDNLMHNEGEAQFHATQVRAELQAAGGPDIGIPGSQTADYQRVYDDFSAGTITRAQAIDQMGTLMGNEQVSTPPYQPYRDYYADSFRGDWDTNIAPTRRP